MATESGGSRAYLYLTVCTGNLVALVAGMNMAWTSPVLPKLVEEQYIKNNPFGKLISMEEASWIGALLPVGGVFGPFVAGFASDRIGRKKSVLLCCIVPATAAFLTFAFAKHLYFYFIARLLAGFAVSSAYTVIPLYNGEIAEVAIRGRICATITTFETTGELFSYCVGPYVTIFWFCVGALSLTLASGALIILVLPESPYFLIAQGERDAAEKALMKLRSDTSDGVKVELDLIESIAKDARSNKGTVCDIFKSKGLRKAQTISVSLIVFQLGSGIIPVLFYAQTIFEATGSTIPPEICTMIIGTVQFLASFVTPNLVDRLGRQWMLFISATGMCISEANMGLYFFLKSSGKNVDSIYWLPVTSLLMFMVFYIMGFGPLPWTVMGEIFPSNMKSAASTVTVCVCWSFAFVVSKSFISVSGAIGIAGSFWIFSGSCCLAAIFVWTYLIETKGKNFQEIQDILNN